MTKDKPPIRQIVVRALLGYTPSRYGWTIGAVAVIAVAVVAVLMSTGVLRWVAMGALIVATGGLFSDHPIRSVLAGVAAMLLIALGLAA